MRKPGSCCRLFLLLTPPLFLLLPIGILVFALDRISNSLIRSEARNTRFSGGQGTGNYISAIDFNQGPSFAILGICALVYIVGAIDVFGIWELQKIEGTPGHQRMWAWVMLVSNVVMTGASAGVMGYASAVQSSEANLQGDADISDDDQQITRETWACKIRNSDAEGSWAGPACGLEKATRFLLIPMAVSSALVLVSLWVLVRQRGGFRWLFGGKGRYGGFPNAYEMRPTSPGAQHMAPPPQQWPPYPNQQWSPHPVPQWTAQASQQWPPAQYQSVPQQPLSPGGVPGNPGVKTDQQFVFR